MKYLLFFSGTVYSGKQTGGIKRFAELANCLCKTGEDVTLCSQDDKDDLPSIGFSSHIKLGPPTDSFWGRFLPQELRIVANNISTIKNINNCRYDKVIVFDVPPSFGLSLFGVRNLVLMIRKDIIACEKSNLKRSSLGWINLLFLWFSEAICLMRAQKIVFQCLYDLKTTKGRHPFISHFINRKSATQINNVNPSWMKSHENNNSREIDSQLFKICCIGDFDNLRKGHDIFLEVAKRMQDVPNTVFYIVGGGESFDYYKLRYSYDNIIFTGRLKDPSLVMKECNLLVVPSRTDSCPNVIIEAFNNGVPVIGSKVGGIPELLDNNNALFDLSIDSLEMAIKTYINNRALLQELKVSQKARKDQLTFNWGEKIISLIR